MAARRLVEGAGAPPTTLAEALVQLEEANDTLRAIQAGEMDALVGSDGGDAYNVFGLSTADRPYRMFVENMREGAATVTAAGVVLYANDRLADLLRRPRDEVVGAALSSFISGASAEGWLELGHGDGSGATLELELIDGDGAVVPVLVGASPLEVDRERLMCLTFTDLSGQRAQEEEIARLIRAQIANGLRFTAMVEALQEGVLVQDGEGRVLEANQAASELLGVPIDELVTAPPSPLIWAADAVDGPPMLSDGTPGRRALTYGQPVLGVLVEVDGGQGERRWLEINSVPLRLPSESEVPVVISSFRDVTARKQAEDQARRLSAIVESSSDAIIGMTVDRVITSWNPGATALFGYEADEALGQNVSMLAASLERDRLLARLGAANGMSLTDVETQCRTKGGSIVDVSMSISPILDDVGHAVGLSGIGRDITERIALERIAEVSRSTLLDAQHSAELEATGHEEANRASRAKSEFLSRMSHELRTPLHAILGFGQILLMDDLTTEQRENVGYIGSAGDHLLGLINDVLDISRIEAGTLRMSLEPVNLNEVVASALSLIGPQAAQNGISLPTGIDADDDLYVHSDRQRLLQVMLNLLSNAVKYNRPGGKIEVGCESSGGTVSISVSDTGIGISEHDLGKLFTPFERLGAERAGVEGTGVGLALSRALGQQMGGSLSAFSTIGTGSTFVLELPAGPPAAHTPPAATVAPPARGVSSKVLTVLAIEDNIANIRLLERFVDHCDNVVLLTAIQGRLGLELASLHHPDLVLLDLHLPDLPGESVLQRLRTDPATAAIPVVVCSGDASDGRRRECLALGAAAYLTKPFMLDQLFELIDRLRSGDPLAPDPTVPR